MSFVNVKFLWFYSTIYKVLIRMEKLNLMVIMSGVEYDVHTYNICLAL